MKTYTVVGDKKKVTLPNNNTRLKVIGNNCIVRVQKNDGEIEVIGNECRLEVNNNHGVINLVGYNCVVDIGKRHRGDKVQLMGQRTQLLVNGEKKGSTFDAQMSPFTKDLDDMIQSIFDFSFVSR